jgi:hypothetical protein
MRYDFQVPRIHAPAIPANHMIEYHPCRNWPSVPFIGVNVGTSDLVTYSFFTIAVAGA